MKAICECLNSCSGCEMAILNLGEQLIDFSDKIDFVHMPILMDNKYCDPLEDSDKITLPDADIGFVSGGIRNKEHLEIAQEMRKRCKVLVALGTCATHGGIPAMINTNDNAALFEQYYQLNQPNSANKVPDEGLPKLLDRCYAIDEHVKTDLYLPGCPPQPDNIKSVLESIINHTKAELPSKSVCDTCPTMRKGTGQINQIKRMTFQPHIDHSLPVDNLQCLLEQGLICMGPVTRAGCAKDISDAPRCINAGVPCKGCYGPVLQNGNQLLDMLNALVSNDVDITSLLDRENLLRFSGAHNRLVSKKEYY